MKKTPYLALGAALAFAGHLGAAEPGAASPAAPVAPVPAAEAPAEVAAKDPTAMTALAQMGSYLRALKAFQVSSEIVKEDVLDDGQKVSMGSRVEMLVARPNRARIQVSSDEQQRLYLYDGKTATVWAGLLGFYASVAAPPTLPELVHVLNNKYDIELPLQDLFLWGTEKADPGAITSALDLGFATMGGATCEHYVFRQPGLDWQIWIQLGDHPLPRKLVITTTSDEARPQSSSVITWNLAPSYNEEAFKFEPPADAKRIALAEALPNSPEK
ncbi:MAG: DUF2092 domain-containing protein [Gammaproteobacteria bacterium]|nr:DUF2092 domain-containing protein [Gammaproteobacteria bacterium]